VLIYDLEFAGSMVPAKQRFRTKTMTVFAFWTYQRARVRVPAGRAEVMKLWRGEQWFLQVDSHCRFAAGWDDKLIRMAGQTGSPKPVLSTYAGFMTRITTRFTVAIFQRQNWRPCRLATA
jgi:Glycosyltransferase (GlcNAc)